FYSTQRRGGAKDGVGGFALRLCGVAREFFGTLRRDGAKDGVGGFFFAALWRGVGFFLVARKGAAAPRTAWGAY
ncbi:MAG: hypothetical protein EAY75_01220, partial [Bacteroidetes bacterium]